MRACADYGDNGLRRPPTCGGSTAARRRQRTKGSLLLMCRRADVGCAAGAAAAPRDQGSPQKVASRAGNFRTRGGKIAHTHSHRFAANFMYESRDRVSPILSVLPDDSLAYLELGKWCSAGAAKRCSLSI